MDGFTESIVVVLGNPIAGNPTQFAIEKGLASIPLDWRVLSLEVASENLEVAIEGFRVTGIRAVWLDSNLASEESDGYVRKDGQWESFQIRREVSDRLALRSASEATENTSDAADGSSPIESPSAKALSGDQASVESSVGKAMNRKAMNTGSAKSTGSRKSAASDADSGGRHDSPDPVMESSPEIRELAEQIQVCFERWSGEAVALDVLIEAIEEYQSV